jgi:hypothetical protein
MLIIDTRKMEAYQTLIDMALEEIERPLPKPCLKTRFCVMAGGCQECMLIGIKDRPRKSHIVEESL